MQFSSVALAKLKDSDNRILFDWFSFSSRIDSFETLASLIGLSNVNWQLKFGVRGYSQRYVFEGITIHYAGYGGSRFSGSSRETVVKGAWLEMTGQGCRTFESYGTGDWKSLVNYCVFNSQDITVNRVDLAYDDFKGFLDIDSIFDDALSLNFVSKFRNVYTTTSIDTSTHDIGKTVCHGKESSDVYIRIYDKLVEQHAYDYLDHWVRAEIMLRHERAASALELLSDDNLSNLSEIYFLILNNYLRYISPSETDSNRWRAPLAPHWEKFSNSVTSFSISLYSAPGVDYNVVNLKNYVVDTSGSAILTFIKIFGVEKLLELVQQKLPFLSPKYRSLLDSFDDGNLSLYSFDDLSEDDIALLGLEGGSDVRT